MSELPNVPPSDEPVVRILNNFRLLADEYRNEEDFGLRIEAMAELSIAFCLRDTARRRQIEKKDRLPGLVSQERGENK